MEGLFQPTHLLLILVIVLVLFGGKKLPELGKGLGEAIRGFKSSMHDAESTPDAPPPAPKVLPDNRTPPSA